MPDLKEATTDRVFSTRRLMIMTYEEFETEISNEESYKHALSAFHPLKKMKPSLAVIEFLMNLRHEDLINYTWLHPGKNRKKLFNLKAKTLS